MDKDLKILLVEDNPGDVLLIKQFLKDSGLNFKLTITDRVTDALIKIRKGHDIILSDLNLPDSSGLETLKRLKESGTEVPILILTGLNNEEIAIISLQQGAQDFLNKNHLNSETLSKHIKFTMARKIADEKKNFTIEILNILNESNDLSALTNNILKKIKSLTSFNSAAIRIKNNNDFPFFKQSGFSDEFIEIENQLCIQGANGKIILDKEDKPIHACLCGMILNAEIDRSKKYFTQYGSFFSNQAKEDIYDIVSNTKYIHGKCIEEGFISVAMIPIHFAGKIIGLIHIADVRQKQISLDTVNFLEDISNTVGIAIGKFIKS